MRIGRFRFAGRGGRGLRRVAVERLVRIAFSSGAVVGNGYRSFRNGLEDGRNATAATEILDCPVFAL